MLHLPERIFSYIISYSTAIFNRNEVTDFKKKPATSIVLHRHVHIFCFFHILIIRERSIFYFMLHRNQHLEKLLTLRLVRQNVVTECKWRKFVKNALIKYCD